MTRSLRLDTPLSVQRMNQVSAGAIFHILLHGENGGEKVCHGSGVVTLLRAA